MARKIIRKRINELMDVSARRAQLSRMQILERVFDDWEACRRLGQMASAATNAKMLGSEMHKMFTERKEIGGPGDFDSKSPEELLQYIQGELAEMGMDAKQISKQLGIKLEGDDNQDITLLPPVKSLKTG